MKSCCNGNRAGVFFSIYDGFPRLLHVVNFFISELIAFTTVISNRVSAAKSAKVTTKHVDGSTAKTLAKWRSQGLSLTAIWKRAKKEGLTTEAGDNLS